MEKPFRLIPTRLKKIIKEEASQVDFKGMATSPMYEDMLQLQ
jgi:hypothetical protein